MESESSKMLWLCFIDVVFIASQMQRLFWLWHLMCSALRLHYCLSNRFTCCIWVLFIIISNHHYQSVVVCVFGAFDCASGVCALLVRCSLSTHRPVGDLCWCYVAWTQTFYTTRPQRTIQTFLDIGITSLRQPFDTLLHYSWRSVRLALSLSLTRFASCHQYWLQLFLHICGYVWHFSFYADSAPLFIFLGMSAPTLIFSF